MKTGSVSNSSSPSSASSRVAGFGAAPRVSMASSAGGSGEIGCFARESARASALDDHPRACRQRRQAALAVYTAANPSTEEIVVRVRRQVSGALAAVLVGMGALALSAGPTAPSGPPGPRRPVPLVRATPTSRSPATVGTTSALRPRPHLHAAGAAPAPVVGELSGVATIDLVATQNLDRFNLDLRGLDVQAITVNGKPAGEVAPPAAGAEVEGAAYWQVQDDAAPHLGAHDPAPPQDQAGADGARRRHLRRCDHSADRHRGRPLRLGDHAGRRHGGERARGRDDLYPVSDHQTDKATYGFEITVPEGKVAVANGLPAGDPVTEGVDDLVLGRPRPAGQLSQHRLGR